MNDAKRRFLRITEVAKKLEVLIALTEIISFDFGQSQFEIAGTPQLLVKRELPDRTFISYTYRPAKFCICQIKRVNTILFELRSIGRTRACEMHDFAA